MLKLNFAISFLLFSVMAHSLTMAQRAEFNDQYLQTILAASKDKQSAGLIYAWSPRMPLSILGVEELSKIAKTLQLPLYVVLDPAAIETEVLSASADNTLLSNSPKMVSNVLASMSMKIHYPSLVIYKNGLLLTPSRPGYDEPERLEEFIIRRLK